MINKNLRELINDWADAIYATLLSQKIGFESLVFLHHRLDLRQGSVEEILALQSGSFTVSPCFESLAFNVKTTQNMFQVAHSFQFSYDPCLETG